MKLSSYWWDIDQDLTPSFVGDLPARADVVVIGGGFTGLSAALTASRHGRSVVVLDAGQPGFGASTRNGGICSGHIRIPHAGLTSQYGKDFADNVYGEGIEARADLVQFCKDEQIDCHITQAGHFNGAMTVKAYDAMAAQADALNAIPGHDVEVIPKHCQHEEIVTDRFHGGLLRREIGGYHPGLFFAGLLRVIQREDITVIANTPAQSIDDDHTMDSPNAKIVTTPRGQIRAGQVIVATNGYNHKEKSFSSFISKRIVPVQSCIIVTETLGREAVQEIMPGMRMYGNTDKVSAYFRPVPEQDRILLGARSFDRETPGPQTFRFLRNKLVDMLPQLAHAKIDYCWLGNVAFNRRLLPGLFQSDGVFYASGYAGSGTVWARWLGQKAAEMALGLTGGPNGTKPSVFYNTPPKPVPMYNGNPWFMPFVVGFFAAQDKLGEWSHRRG